MPRVRAAATDSGVDIDAHHLRAAVAKDRRQLAVAAAQVENALTGGGSQQLDDLQAVIVHEAHVAVVRGACRLGHRGLGCSHRSRPVCRHFTVARRERRLHQGRLRFPQECLSYLSRGDPGGTKSRGRVGARRGFCGRGARRVRAGLSAQASSVSADHGARSCMAQLTASSTSSPFKQVP